MKIIVISSLLGNYSKVSEAIERELGNGRITDEFVNKLPADDLRNLCKELSSKNAALEEERKSLKEELNELYLKYDQMSAAFGEMDHFIKEAASVPARYFEEVQS